MRKYSSGHKKLKKINKKVKKAMKDNKSKSSDSEEPETESETESESETETEMESESESDINQKISPQVLESKTQVEEIVNNLATLTDKVDSMSNDLLEIKEMLNKLN